MQRVTRAIAVAALAVVFMAPAALATHELGHFPLDDKNNPTFPGVGNGVTRSERAFENALENCAAHYLGDKGGESENLPAQCQRGRWGQQRRPQAGRAPLVLPVVESAAGRSCAHNTTDRGEGAAMIGPRHLPRRRVVNALTAAEQHRRPSMNANATTGQARIQPRDDSALLRANGFAGASLAGLEWQRGCQVEAELDWRLKHHGGTPQTSRSRVALLRQTIGVVLVHAGERLAGVPRGDVAPQAAPAPDTLGLAG